MSNRSRNFLIGIGVAILMVFVVAGAAILAYNAGRNSVTLLNDARPEESQDQAAVSVEYGEITVVPQVGEEEGGASATPEAEPTVAVEPTRTAVSNEAAEPAEQETEPTPAPTPAGPTQPEEVQEAGATGDPASESGPREPVELDEGDLDLLIEVWEIIDEEFDGNLPLDENVTYSAIAGSLELLDDTYTRFVTPNIAAQMREQLRGSFEGIGAFVDLDPDGYLVIVRSIEDQPADRAGLLSGDLITHVNGESVLGKSLDEITAEIKGPQGTTVTLTIVRESLPEPFELTVTRERIEIPIVTSEMLEDNIAYVRLTGFSGNASQQLESELEELLDQEPQALIFDLRDNPGGFLSQSVQVADLFLGEGVVLYERDGRELEEVFESEDGDLAEEIELIVLVNAGSASASEIVAGAVKDRGRGTLVGETTFGKGSVQKTHTLSDGSELRVTIARWYTPNDRSIDVEGVAPDIQVDTPEEFGGDADTQLQRAIRLILEGQ
jgi:carboxyl-terminal processing protease